MERETQSAYSRLKASGVLDALARRASEMDPYRFCQLLERAVPDNALLGSTASPADDPVRFRPHPGMGFAGGELKAVEFHPGQAERPASVRTRLLGLYGTDSPLPTRYIDDIAQQREGHEALEAFLDIFNHRIFTQFYRVWRKHAYPASFAAGGTDATSQCLLGLIGLGVAGAAENLGTPLSRFLALLGVMRLPTRNGEGVSALVGLIAARTRVQVQGHDPTQVLQDPPPRLSPSRPPSLNASAALGGVASDGSTRLLLQLFTDDLAEGLTWLPGNERHRDLMLLLRVYLGWRCTARLQLSLPVSCLPAAQLGQADLLLGMTAVLGPHLDPEQRITIELGGYQGLTRHPQPLRDIQYVDCFR